METQALAFKLAREDGLSFPNSLHYFLASTIVEGTEARQRGEEALEEARGFSRMLEPIARKSGHRANR